MSQVIAKCRGSPGLCARAGEFVLRAVPEPRPLAPWRCGRFSPSGVGPTRGRVARGRRLRVPTYPRPRWAARFSFARTRRFRCRSAPPARPAKARWDSAPRDTIGPHCRSLPSLSCRARVASVPSFSRLEPIQYECRTGRIRKPALAPVRRGACAESLKEHVARQVHFATNSCTRRLHESRFDKIIT
jgi:hypothetical protein